METKEFMGLIEMEESLKKEITGGCIAPPPPSECTPWQLEFYYMLDPFSPFGGYIERWDIFW